MKRKRRKFTKEFKEGNIHLYSKVRFVLEAFRGPKTVSEIGAEFEIHPVMVSNWKKEMLTVSLKYLKRKALRRIKMIKKRQVIWNVK